MYRKHIIILLLMSFSDNCSDSHFVLLLVQIEKGRRQNVSILSPTLADREWILFLTLQPSPLPSYTRVSVKRVPE